LAAAAGLAAAVLGACGRKPSASEMAEAQDKAAPPKPQQPATPEITPRADNVLGDPKAPVTVYEYASITCPHCKAWHDEVWPEFKAKYVDTGKVRFVFRELPTGPENLSLAGFLLARCAPEDKYFTVLDQLFDKQLALFDAYQNGKARDALNEIGKSVGVTPEQFDACLMNQAEIARIEQLDDDGQRLYGVDSTPTFVINGQAYPGETPLEALSQVIDPLLPSSG
jgi:protein-disulfide isomerase